MFLTASNTMLIDKAFKFTVKTLLALLRKSIQKVSDYRISLVAPRGYLRRNCLPIYEIMFPRKYARTFAKYNIILLFELH